MPKLDLSRVPLFPQKYIALVENDSLADAFAEHQEQALTFLKAINEERWDYRYAPDKWSIKEMVQHLIDAERVFCYRALCIARKEPAPLPSFDENLYAAASKADKRSKGALLAEFETVQKGSALLFNSFDEEQLDASGIANGELIYVSAIGFILIGHMLHHKRILQERYL